MSENKLEIPDPLLKDLLQAMEHLRQEVDQLKQENQDLQIALSTTAEHGDVVEAELCEANQQLRIEVTERQRAETMLQMLLNLLYAERSDLEIVVQTLMEHGDSVDIQWNTKLNELHQLAALDGLTQIANRRRFDQYFEQQWRLGLRNQSPVSIVLCDLDYFKPYNDTYGHLGGDDCLKQVAKAIARSLKRPCDLAARFGGEEFAVILPDTDLMGAKKVADRIHAEIAALHIPHACSLVSDRITISIGVASTVPTTPDAAAHLNLADQQLYLAKQRGRNQTVCWELPVSA